MMNKVMAWIFLATLPFVGVVATSEIYRILLYPLVAVLNH